MNCPRSLNVFRGEMSLIGPRPDDLPHAHAFLADIPGYRQRYAGRPGISGLAQVELGYVHGRAGACRKTALDLHYIRHAGLRLDARDLLAHAQDRRRPQGAVTPRGPKTPWPSPRRGAISRHKPRRTGM
jgi:lipopolysaccharide/colanic/teichoic acid biosynthesis glycosyltransferase